MKTKLIWALIISVLLGLTVWALWPKPVGVELDEVRVGRFERFIQEDGITQLRERYVVSSPLLARLARMDWKPGDTVKRGEVLATLSAVSPALLDARALAGAQARLGVAQANVLRAQANLARAQAAAQQAELERARTASLAQSGFVSDAQTQEVALAAQLRAQEQAIARQEQSAAGQALRAAQAELKSYTDQAKHASKPGGQITWPVLSPLDATVLKVHQGSEDVVQAGAPLLELGEPGALEVVVDVLTEEAAQITPGLAAVLSRWGGAADLPATVRLVEPAAFTKVSALGVQEQRVNVVLDIDTPPAARSNLGDGFKVAVTILVQSQDQALMVPVSALFPYEADTALFVVKGERAQRKTVQVLARNGIDAWVRPLVGSALSVGTQVIVYPPTNLTEGSSIAATAKSQR